MNEETPRTDAAMVKVGGFWDPDSMVVPVEFAQQLELELRQAEAMLRALKDMGVQP